MQVDKGRLEARKGKFQIVILNHSARKIVDILPLMGQLINLSASRIGQAHDTTYLIIGFTNRIIPRFPDNLIDSRFWHIDQFGMATRYQKGHEGIGQILDFTRRHQVSGHMVDRNQRQTMGPGKGLGSRHAHQKGPNQTRTVGHRHGIQVLGHNPSFLEGILNAEGHHLHMVAAGHFGYHPAKALVALHLTGNDIAEQVLVIFQNSHTGLITGGLDGQYISIFHFFTHSHFPSLTIKMASSTGFW